MLLVYNSNAFCAYKCLIYNYLGRSVHIFNDPRLQKYWFIKCFIDYDNKLINLLYLGYIALVGLNRCSYHILQLFKRNISWTATFTDLVQKFKDVRYRTSMNHILQLEWPMSIFQEKSHLLTNPSDLKITVVKYGGRFYPS